MTGSTILLVGIFTIFIGFLMIFIGTAVGLLQNSESRQDYSGKSESLGKETYSGDTSEYSRYPFEKLTAGKAETKVKAGGVIMLGPIPIIFGSDKESAKTASILAIILMLLSLLLLRGWLL